MESFDDELFTMTSFPAKKSEKTILLGEVKHLKVKKWSQKRLVYC